MFLPKKKIRQDWKLDAKRERRLTEKRPSEWKTGGWKETNEATKHTRSVSHDRWHVGILVTVQVDQVKRARWRRNLGKGLEVSSRRHEIDKETRAKRKMRKRDGGDNEDTWRTAHGGERRLRNGGTKKQRWVRRGGDKDSNGLEVCGTPTRRKYEAAVAYTAVSCFDPKWERLFDSSRIGINWKWINYIVKSLEITRKCQIDAGIPFLFSRSRVMP